MSAVLTVMFLLFMECSSTLTPGLGFPRGSNVSAVAKRYECLDKERDALLLFKAGIRDDFGFLSSWSSQQELDCCKWWGVHCSSSTGHVTELHLRGEINPYGWLSGEISPSLLELHHLNYLDLSLNYFSFQPIPGFIGSLANLKYLDLSNSGFRSVIPSQLGNLSNLNYLNLRGNSFPNQTIPKFIGSLTKLKYLDLSFCWFHGTIPSQLGNLSNLDYLAIQRNSKVETNLVEWLPGLTSLRHLYLDDVDLSKAIRWPGIIKNLSFLSHVSFRYCRLSNVTYPLIDSSSSSSSLTDLYLDSNHLSSSIFHWLFNVSSNLVNLTLAQNQLDGPIPNSFGNMTSLALLDLSHNQLHGGIPKSFRTLCRLKSLHLHYNSINGSLVDSLNNLQSGCAVIPVLEELYADDNKLTGSLPDGIIRFASLKTLYLFNNRLDGNVSRNLGRLSKLEILDLSVNSLHGVLSEAHLLNLPNLVYLNLSFNSLALVLSSNWVPPFQLVTLDMNFCKPGPSSLEWIQTQKNLSYLTMANCGISAKIPESFWNQLRSLVVFNISGNQIRGKVPNFPPNFQVHTDDLTIDLSSNHLEGPIPRTPPSVKALDLSKNMFSGSLSMLCQITDIEFTFLDLSQNSLTGGLPNCLLHFRKLRVLNLAYNKLSQNLSASSGSLFGLTTLNLYNNSFFGDLPLFLRNCTYLRFLNLGANQFSGNVPAWIGEELQLLYALSLRSNKFFGVIPFHICHQTNLQILDLSTNSFFGSIPSCLNNLSAMAIEQSSIQVANHRYNSTLTIGEFVDYASVEWQGSYREFERTLGLLKIIDLSINQLTGEVPNAITTLRGLVILNLSKNKLHGKIPEGIGQMKSLQSLNFSRNEFSGHIPQGMSMLSFLNNLDLSHNYFSGRIPSGTQIQSFDSSAFAENFGLCGPPLPQKCPGDEPPPVDHVDSDNHQENNNEFLKWLYIGMSTGFITGFWGVCGALLLNRRCRHAFFRFFDAFIDTLYVQVAMRLRNRRV